MSAVSSSAPVVGGPIKPDKVFFFGSYDQQVRSFPPVRAAFPVDVLHQRLRHGVGGQLCGHDRVLSRRSRP